MGIWQSRIDLKKAARLIHISAVRNMKKEDTTANPTIFLQKELIRISLSVPPILVLASLPDLVCALYMMEIIAKNEFLIFVLFQGVSEIVIEVM